MQGNSTTTASMAEHVEDFLYTPHGLATLALASALLVSLAWLLGCVVFCCCRRRRQRMSGGSIEASRDLHYFGMSDPSLGTMTSGYNTGPQLYASTGSVLSTENANGLHHSSLDSIIDRRSS